MREDMAKVIVERPRIGGGHKPKGYDRRLVGPWDDDLPTQESMRFKYKASGCNKSFNEHLGPLYRFLESSLGRPWDAVFSEICARINLNSTIQRHIRQHVDSYVCTTAYLCEDGSYWHVDSHGPEQIGRYSWPFFFVDAAGLLRKNPYVRVEPPKEAPKFVEKGDMRFEKKDGLWFVTVFAPLPKGLMKDGFPTVRGRIVDAVLRKPLYLLYDEEKGEDISSLSMSLRLLFQPKTLTSVHGKSGVYAKVFKSASSKELRAAGL